MKILTTIWHDIRSGDPTDVYITILAVFTLGISALRSVHHFQQITSLMSSSRQFFPIAHPGAHLRSQKTLSAGPANREERLEAYRQLVDVHAETKKAGLTLSST